MHDSFPSVFYYLIGQKVRTMHCGNFIYLRSSLNVVCIPVQATSIDCKMAVSRIMYWENDAFSEHYSR